MRCHSVGYGLASQTRSCITINSTKFRSRSYDAVIRVYDDAGKVINARVRGRVQRVVSRFVSYPFKAAFPSCPFSLDGKEHWILALSYAEHIVLARPATR